MDSFIWPSAEKTECSTAGPNVTQEEKCTAQWTCIESLARHILQPVGLLLDHLVPIGKTVSGQYYCALLQEKERWGLRRKRELRENCVILLLDNATLHRHSDVQYLVQRWGWCWHIPPTLLMSPSVINGCLKMLKNTFGVNDLNLKTISTLLSQPLCRVIVWHTDGKSVWTVMLITPGRGSVWTFRNISSVLILYFVITTQSYAKFLQWPTYLG